MSYWYCRECRTIYSEGQLLPGWDGWWCANCIWSCVEEVTPSAAPRPHPETPRKPSRHSLVPTHRPSPVIDPRRTRRSRRT